MLVDIQTLILSIEKEVFSEIPCEPHHICDLSRVYPTSCPKITGIGSSSTPPRALNWIKGPENRIRIE